jgi:hypothetical protein
MFCKKLLTVIALSLAMFQHPAALLKQAAGPCSLALASNSPAVLIHSPRPL